MPTTRKRHAMLQAAESKDEAEMCRSNPAPSNDENLGDAKTRCRRTLYEIRSASEEAEHACTKKQKIRESEDCFETGAHQDESFAPYELEQLKRLQKLNPEHNPKHNYVQYRELLVGFIIDVCEELNLEPITMHAALNYLDRILSKLSISRRCYQLVATACICIAAKFEEQPHNVPSLSVLASKSIAGLECKQQLVHVERVLLEHLQWNALSATHLHFSQCFVARGVLFPSDTLQGQALTGMDKRLVLRHIDFLAMLSLHHYDLLRFDQARVAAAAVAVARTACGILPEWPPELAAVVGFTEEEVRQCRERLQALYNENEEQPPASPNASSSSVAVKEEGEAECEGGSSSSSPKCVVAAVGGFGLPTL